jgi:hypothetical protein
LEKKLVADGWTAQTIRVDDGCYQVRASNARGERLEARFNPATLEMVSRKGDDDGRESERSWNHGQSRHRSPQE